MQDVALHTVPATQKRFSGVRVFLFLSASLCSTILLKIAEIQYLEIIYFLQLCVLVALFPSRGFRVKLYRPVFRLGILYAIFMVIALISALAALRNDFYFPSQLSLLKHPIWITMSRIAELTIDVGIMVYLVQLFRADIRNLIFALRVYYWVGIAGCVYSIISFPLNIFFDLQLGTYYDLHRMRGFFNEGSPFGVFMISELLVGMILLRQGWISRKHFRITLVISVIGLIGSQSKAAIFAAVVMMIFNALMVKQASRRIAVLLGVILLSVLAYSIPHVRDQIEADIQGSSDFEYTSNMAASDPNYVYGRIAGAFIVPRMIAAHPYLGVGWGNYGIVRDSPQYRGAAAFADYDDSPGLGVLGMVAEVGIPGTLFLLCIFCFPYLYARRIGAPLVVKNLALMQPVIHLVGGQLNFTHPWMLTAFSFALCDLYRHHRLIGYDNSPIDGAQPALSAPAILSDARPAQ